MPGPQRDTIEAIYTQSHCVHGKSNFACGSLNVPEGHAARIAEWGIIKLGADPVCIEFACCRVIYLISRNACLV